MYDSEYLQRLGLSGISEQIEREFEERRTTISNFCIDDYLDELRYGIDLRFPFDWSFDLYEFENPRQLYYGKFDFPEGVDRDTLLLSTPTFQDCFGLGYEVDNEEGVYMKNQSHLLERGSDRLRSFKGLESRFF